MTFLPNDPFEICFCSPTGSNCELMMFIVKDAVYFLLAHLNKILYCRSVLFSTILLWSNLSSDVRNASSYPLFKRKLKCLIIADAKRNC
jgi:hypothetical protein